MTGASQDKGFVFSATGEEFVDEAVQSARRLRHVHEGEVGIVLFTDRAQVEGPFTNVIPFDPPAYDRTDKVRAMLKSPFERTIFLDTDTYAVGHLNAIFNVLDTFDLAAAHAPGRIKTEGESDQWHTYHSREVPPSFPAYNTGVVGYKNHRSVELLFQRWIDRYREAKDESTTEVQDQPAFREVLFHSSNIRVATLTPEYNCRLNVTGYVKGRVKLIHGRRRNMKKTSDQINNTDRKRIYLSSRIPEVAFTTDMSIMEKIFYFMRIIHTHFRLTSK